MRYQLSTYSSASPSESLKIITPWVFMANIQRLQLWDLLYGIGEL